MALALILCGSFCLAGTTDPNVSDNKYIEYGNKHECVVKFHSIDSHHGIGSAVLVAPRIVITAAHMVVGAKEVYVTHGDKKINVDIVLFRSEYLDDMNNNVMSSNDIAVCHLTEAININFYPSLYSNDDEVGKICSICGFGVSGRYNTGVTIVDNQKRAGSNFVDTITSGMLECSINKGPKTSLEFLIAHGDSGGGLFIDQKLAGINSLIYTDSSDKKLNSDYKDVSCHTRISQHSEWINRVISVFKSLESE